MTTKRVRFNKRQQLRKAKRTLHQKRNAKLMQKLGGYNSFKWHTFIDKIKQKIIRKLQMTQARKEAKLSNA